jgi:hypothetical protein
LRAAPWRSSSRPSPRRLPKPGDELGEVTAGRSRIELAVAPLAGQTPSGAPLAFGAATSIAVVKSSKVRHQRAGGLLSADLDPTPGRVYVAVEDAVTYRTDSNSPPTAARASCWRCRSIAA